MINIKVSINPFQAASIVEKHVASSGISAELIDRYTSVSPDGRQIAVLVFEKYFMRNSSRASLTVTFEDLRGECSVHAVGSGGGQGTLFKFDWGAGDSFENDVEDALEKYIIG